MNSRNYSKRLTLLAAGFLLLFCLPAVVAITVASAQTPEPTPETQSTPHAAAPEISSAGTAETTNSIESVVAAAPDDLVHYGDVVEIDVIGTSEYDWTGKIDQDGFIAGLSFTTEPIFALCRAEADIGAKVTAAYGKYLRNPQISVRIINRSGRPEAMLMGAVRNQHRFQIKRPVRLNELIALAGGLVDNASGEIQILRPEKLSCGENPTVLTRARTVETASPYIKVKIADLIAGAPDANPFVRSGDIVTVQEAAAVYVIGGVANPQKIFARQEMTVSRAVSVAGGLVKGGGKNVTIYRRKDGVTTAIEADLVKIEAKTAEDTVLLPFDIVDVPLGARDPKKQPPIIAGEGNSRQKGETLPLIIVD